MVSHSNQLINWRHLQMFPKPLNGLLVWLKKIGKRKKKSRTMGNFTKSGLRLESGH